MPISQIHFKTSKYKPDGYPTELMTIGDHIKKKRLDLSISQAKVAHSLGLNENTIAQWELNHKKPLISFMPKIVSFLGYVPLIGIDKGTLRGKVISYRTKHGITQKELAKLITIDSMAIKALEKGKAILPKHEERIKNFLRNSNKTS